jgi:hypothetical protein
MHAVTQLMEFWAAAFLSLAMAVVLLNIYFGLIGNDLELLTAGKEAAIAGIASLVEAAGLWLILSFAPSALRAMILPALIVAVIYKMAHLVDWSRYDVLMLLAFQVVIAFVGLSLMRGLFQEAIIILVGFAFCLAAIAGIMRSF